MGETQRHQVKLKKGGIVGKGTGKRGVRPTTRAEREAHKGGKKGREAFVPTDAQRQFVSMMAAIGIPQPEMCLHIPKKDGAPIAVGTLQKYFKRELDSGSSKATVKVAGKLFSAAMEGNMTAIIFWLKTKGGFVEKQQVNMADANGEPLAAPPSLADFYSAVTLSSKDGAQSQG